jgi:hypothetical protein
VGADLNRRRHEQAWEPGVFRIGENGTGERGAGLFVDHRRHIGDATLGVGDAIAGGDPHLLALADEHQVLGVGAEIHPHRAQVGDDIGHGIILEHFP